MPDGRIADQIAVEGTFFEEKFFDTFMLEMEHRKDGTVFMSADGEIATESGMKIHRKGIASGSRKPDGSYVIKGVACLSCPPGKLSWLNSIALLFEAEVDDAGIYQFKGWEWK